MKIINIARFFKYVKSKHLDKKRGLKFGKFFLKIADRVWVYHTFYMEYA